MVTLDGQIKIIDLGLAKFLVGTDRNGFMKTEIGTRMYRAPEIEAGKDYQGADADLFAWAVSLLIFKTRDYPWHRASPNDQEYTLLGCNNGIRSNEFWMRQANY